MKIGVITDCFKSNLAASIKAAAALGLSGVQIYATTGEFSLDTLTNDKKAEYKKLLSENHLEISALCGDMGGFGFENELDNRDRIEKTKRIVDLAVEFSASIVTTHIGVIPNDKSDPQYHVMLDALTECGVYAKSRGVTLAIETGPETANTLLAFIEDTKGGVGVNLDPANFVMVTGQDPVAAVYTLRDHIVHTHAKDGVKLSDDKTPTEIYHAFAVGGVDALNACETFEELPLGDGSVDWRAYLNALADIGYDGYLTVERECGDDPKKDIIKAVHFLENALNL